MVGNKPSKKKTPFPINPEFREYLKEYSREVNLPVSYRDLKRFTDAFPLEDRFGNDTLWQTVVYQHFELQELNDALTHIYALLKNDGEIAVVEHLAVARIDFCSFGNTQPFRIRIINRLNDNYDHFYVKKADASRVYGLELEHILSPDKMTFLTDGDTLIEEHVAGIPGDEFVNEHLDMESFDQIRIVKEFIKFNERCFVRLLGDMRSYNYVVDVTPDIEGSQYRIRAIDFDQQSYEDRKSFYLPQYFKENNPLIFMGIAHMSPETVNQYQHEERSSMAARIRSSGTRLVELLEIMKKDRLSTPEKVKKLREELAEHHENDRFLECNSMGELVSLNIQLVLSRAFRQGIAATRRQSGFSGRFL